jgi:RHH-type proline utilization regulon transcriptional repressor/proline dehydrogenase/delta 1-pyrroline-5-carboxylate dehydrogenase
MSVKRGSWYHRTECFGPVLGLMRARDFADAIEIVNDTEFGLTSGLHSLDDREIALWREKIEAGNLYINRGITGAIVRRQPFGGWKKSVFGAAKAGGPNYVFNLCRWERGSGADSYAAAWREYFSREQDPSQVLGESNVFRYRPVRNVLIHVAAKEEASDAALALKAAEMCGVPAVVCEESEDAFLERIGACERVRAFRPLSRKAHERANAAHALVIEAPLSLDGRIELRHYLREQAVTYLHHRYGSIVKGDYV